MNVCNVFGGNMEPTNNEMVSRDAHILQNALRNVPSTSQVKICKNKMANLCHKLISLFSRRNNEVESKKRKIANNWKNMRKQCSYVLLLSVACATVTTRLRQCRKFRYSAPSQCSEPMSCSHPEKWERKAKQRLYGTWMKLLFDIFVFFHLELF